MSDSRAATGFDRLPWLADEPTAKATPPKRGGRDFIAWAAVAVLVVAAIFFWLGTRSHAPETYPAPQTKPAQPSATVALPPAQSAAQVSIVPQPQVRVAPAPELRAAPAPEVRSAPARTIHVSRVAGAEAHRVVTKPASPAPAKPEESAPPAPVATAPPVVRPMPLRPWQPRVVTGAAGRLVEIGAFGSVAQAKRGWWYMVRTYPAVGHLPAVVRPDRNSRGRVFYRFRVGTTSQAHSEVLCQRMQRIRLSCAVVGLPWKAKVER